MKLFLNADCGIRNGTIAVYLVAFAIGVIGPQLVLGAEQAANLPRIGVVLHGGPYYGVLDGLRDGLKAVGLEDGQRLTLVVRDARGDAMAAAGAAQTLEQERVRLIVAITTSVTLAVKRATAQVPIVFIAGTDPVASGLVQSIAKPGGRLTGVHILTSDLTAKRLELLKELLPGLRRIITFYNPSNPVAPVVVRAVRQAGQMLHVQIVERPVPSVEALRAEVRVLTADREGAYFFLSDAMVQSQAQVILDAATAARLPTMAYDLELAASGALVCYGVNYRDLGREAASFVQRILAGAHPEDLPVQEVDRLELAVNLKTSKALGVTIPQSIMIRVDQAIQ